MPDSKVTWVYDAAESSLDKRATRVSVKKPAASELVGFDGNCEGGQRPHPGFIKVHELGFSGANHDCTSVVLDFFPITLKVGSDAYAYGFIYRVRRKENGELADIFVDYWESETGVWHLGESVLASVSITEPMSVSTIGRFAYVFLRGTAPTLFYVDPDDGTAVVETEAGTGRQPVLIAAERTVGITPGALNSTGTNRPGYAYLYLLDTSPEDVTWLSTGQDETDTRVLDAGDYAFAYMLFDSRTGRRGQLSQVAYARANDFVEGAGTELDPYLYNYKYAMVELVYDSTKYDTCYFYRSVRVQSAGGTFTAAILHLDGIKPLSELEVDSTPDTTLPLKHAYYFYRLEDKQLVSQDIFPDRAFSDDEMPSGSSSLNYENCLLVGDVQTTVNSTVDGLRDGDGLNGMGEIRWSALASSSPEVFPPGNRYTPRVPSNAAVRFCLCGGNVIGFGTDIQYFIRKDSTYLRIEELHEGFGITSPFAADTVGSLVYFLSPSGLKSVDSNAALDDVRSINNLVMQEWSGVSLASVSIAFDAATNALYILNADEEETVVLWFNTAKVTQLYDTTFSRAMKGEWPALTTTGENDEDGTLERRAMFLLNPPLDGNKDDTQLALFRPSIFIVDNHRYRKSYGDVGTRTALLHYTGPAILTGEEYVAGSFELTNMEAFVIEAVAVTPFPLDETGMENAYLYVVRSSDPDYVGVKVKVKSTFGSSIYLYNDGTDPLEGLPSDAVFSVSPVFCRWAGSPASLQTEDGNVYAGSADFFKARRASSVGCYFTGVSVGDYPEEYARFAAGAYKGVSEEPFNGTLAYPRGVDGGNYLQSIVENETANYAAIGDTFAETSSTNPSTMMAVAITPVVETYLTDLDYRLVSVAMVGAVTDVARTYQPG